MFTKEEKTLLTQLLKEHRTELIMMISKEHILKDRDELISELDLTDAIISKF